MQEREGGVMLLSSTFDVLRRRWFVLAVGVVVVIAGLTMVSKSVRPQYKASATVLLAEPEPDPYANITGDMTVFTRAVGAIASDAEVSGQLYSSGDTATYSVVPSDSIRSALIVTAYGSTPDVAASTAAAAVSATARSAVDLQARLGVPVGHRILLQPLGSVSVQRYTKNRVRLFALVATGGLALVVLLVSGLEAASRLEGGSAARRAVPRVLWRRRVAIGTVSALFALGVAFVVRAPHQYQASEVVILLPPGLPLPPGTQLSGQGELNPFVTYDRSLDVMAQLATVQVSDSAFAQALAQGGVTVPYTVTNWVAGPDPVDTIATPTPYVTIAANASEPGKAMQTVGAVGRAFGRDIALVQSASNAPPPSRIGVYTAVPAQVYQVPLSRARALAALAGLAVCMGIVGLAAGRMVRRALWRRRNGLFTLAGPIPTAAGPGRVS